MQLVERAAHRRERLRQITEDARYRGVATWAAIPRVDAWSAADRERWRRDGFITVPNARTGREHRIDIDLLADVERNAQRLDIAGACARIETPTLLVHGELDEVVPLPALEHLSRAFRRGVATRLAIGGAGHTFGARHPLAAVPAELEQALSTTVHWFVERLRD